MATWNIVNGRGDRLKQMAAGLAQIGIEVAVLIETKFVDNWYHNMAAGNTILCSKAASCTQGGGALMWKENDLRFEVESVLFHSLNSLRFQLRTGDKKLYVIGTYIPPNCTRGVEGIRRAAEACPAG
jgi:hypothetical protein